MPRQFQFKNPFAKKSKKLRGRFANVVQDESKREKYAFELSKVSGELKRLAKKANAMITSVKCKKYKSEDKLQKDIDKINAVIDDLNTKSTKQNEILGELDIRGVWGSFDKCEIYEFKDQL